MSAQSALCAGDFRVKDIILDSSDRFIFIKGSGDYKQGLEAVQIPSSDSNSMRFISNINSFTIANPTRYVIDIPNATLSGSSRSYKVQNSNLIQNIQLAQFSLNPHIVRVVITLNKGDTSKFQTYTNGSDIVIKYDSKLINNSLQYKFYTPTGDFAEGSGIHNTGSTVTYNATGEVKSVIPRLQTKYYLSQISQNSNGLILRGLGSISMQRASYSLDNTKSEIILDNTTLSSKINNKTFKIPSADKNLEAMLTINKISLNKIKLTLDAQNVRDYRFVVSPDGQSIFVSHRNFIINTIFSSNPASVKSYKAQTTPMGYKLVEINFDKSITYDVFELNDNFYIDINNLGDYNTPLFEQMLETSDIKVQAIKISSDKTRFIIPASNLNLAYANIESNAKSIKLCFKDKPANIANTETPKEVLVATNTETKKEEIKKEEIKKTENIIYIPKEENVKVEKPKKPKEKSTIRSMKKVVIDAGHGGADSGAIGGGIYEKDINLDVAQMVQEKLMKKDIYVFMTRTKDTTMSLEDRVNYSNELSPDIFVSIHTNSTIKDDSYGVETHYFKDDSYNLARIVHNNFASYKNLRKWETIDRGVIKSRFYVINHTEAPSVLIEIGFISNLEERKKLIKKGRKEDIAEAIVDGILEYLKSK